MRGPPRFPFIRQECSEVPVSLFFGLSCFAHDQTDVGQVVFVVSKLSCPDISLTILFLTYTKIHQHKLLRAVYTLYGLT